jgi:hypothetical protein
MYRTLAKIPMLALIAFGCFALLPPGSGAGNFASSMPDLPPPDAKDLGAIAQWSASVDKTGNSYLRVPRSGDYTLSSGTLLDANCFEGLNPHQRESLIEKFETVVNRVLIQGYRCEKALGLTSAGDALSILRRAKVDCKADNRADVGASNSIFGRYKPFQSPFSTVKTNTDKEYQFNVPAHVLVDTSDENLAGYLFHEALHSTANNNRQWHNRVFEDGRDAWSCKSSIFEDRIYFMHSACFPQSDYGKQLRRVISTCSEVCESALTTKDESSGFLRLFRKADTTLSLFVPVGPDLTAALMRPEEANRVCNRIHDVSAIFKQLVTQFNELKIQRQMLSNEFGLALEIPEADVFATQISAHFATLWTLVENAYTGADKNQESLDQAVLELKTGRAAMAASLADTSSCGSICVSVGRKAVAETDRWIALVSGLADRQREYSKPESNLPSVTRILDFFRRAD